MEENTEFTNQVTGEVCILPQGERARSTVDTGLQTSRIKTRENAAQTMSSAFESGEQQEKGINTEPRTIPCASLQGVQYVYESNNNNTSDITSGSIVDANELLTFLQACQRHVLPIIQANAKGNSIFNHYTPNWSSTMREMNLMHTLNWEHAMEKELQVIALAWNCTNSLLAVAYGRTDRVGWCFDEGMVGVWNYMRSDFNPHVPHITIELDSFATTVAFHPTNSQTLAIGTYSGEVVVYENVNESSSSSNNNNAQRDNKAATIAQRDNVDGDKISSNQPMQFNKDTRQVVYSSKRGAWSHEETITQLQWVQNLHEVRDMHRFLLVASAADGLLSYWTTLNALQWPIARYQVTNKHHKQVAVTAFSYTYPGESLSIKSTQRIPSLEGALIVGLESGEVGRGRTNLFSVSLETLLSSKKNTESKHEYTESTTTPLELEWLQGHESPVQSISTSMFFRHVFISAAADGSAHLYSSLARKPALVLIPSSESNQFLYGAKFSPSRPSVVLLYSRSSFIYIYDLQQDNNQPWRVMQGAGEREVVITAEFATDSPYLLALGDGKGRVNVWQLPTTLTEVTEQERNALYMSEASSEASNDNHNKAKEQTLNKTDKEDTKNAQDATLSLSPDRDNGGAGGRYYNQGDSVGAAENAVAQLFKFNN